MTIHYESNIRADFDFAALLVLITTGNNYDGNNDNKNDDIRRKLATMYNSIICDNDYYT